MLWTPLKPMPSGEEGNKDGNPYVDVDQVLAIWRESAPEEMRLKWYNIDPTAEDLIESDSSDLSETEPLAGEAAESEPLSSESTTTDEDEADTQETTGRRRLFRSRVSR
jgi:hypothetical protein